MHEYSIYDKDGDTIDIACLCSDSCHREYAQATYAGWSGCHETEFTTYCAQCGVVIPGSDACDCQSQNVVVNRFLSADGEKCKHGNWIQLPAEMIESHV